MAFSKRDDIRSEIWDLNLIPNLERKVALVTGANVTTGLGWNTARQLALKGAKVYIGARSADKAQGAIDAILEASPSVQKDNLGIFVADFGELKQVKVAANKFIATETRLDILVNNAGLLARPLDKDANGISISMITNHFAVFVLTTTLLPLIKKTAAISSDVRIVNLSSTTHKLVPVSVRFDSLESFNIELGGTDGMPANLFRYGLSKLANLLFVKELQRRFDDEGVNVVSIAVHPGGVKTPGAINFVGGSADSPMLEGSLTPLQGSVTPLFAATAPEVQQDRSKYAGAYLMPFGVPSPDDESRDAKNCTLAKEAWLTTEKIVADILNK
ncbi:hypothetical protein GALMADRAFT_241746 [Galerina marginata CBS 339.88]|uniref:Uncharacterized protein n=1 Tax=Galerina marginata (strain CBS 339.88) TaxID=685588 RepID=A0A067TDF2_GALM3|nr:hypothetical protein GALMADRAFT_241746 [Galerina marginata CBS 339.88]